MELLKKYRYGLLLISIILIGNYLTYLYIKNQRKKDEKETFGKIYEFKRGSKGHVKLSYYFLTETKDTVWSSLDVYSRKTKEYFLNEMFVVNYSEQDPENNGILIDYPYKK